MTSPTTQVEGPEAKGSHKLLVGVAIGLGLMVALVFFSHRGLYQMYRYRHDRVSLDQENARLTEENARLTRTIDRLQHDPEMIQEFIRRELNFVKKNEIVFQLPPGRESKQTSPSSVASVAPAAAPSAKPGKPPDSGNASWAWHFLEGAPKSGSNNVQ
ncbi:MAG: septum formation initiator family protein [Deltaproteobacteria bacterium]|nr:septum formation initiator family protein [Deltaproteobacteria bacterium]